MIKTFFIGLLAGIVLALSGVGLWQYRTAQAPAVEGRTPKALAAETKTPVPCKSLQVYPKNAKQQLNLPAAVVADPVKQVLASTMTPGNEHAHTVTAVTDLGTGDTQMFVKEEPLPWFSTRRSGEVSLAYGFRGMRPSTQFEATEYFAHIKALNFGVTGQVETPRGGFVGITMSMEW